MVRPLSVDLRSRVVAAVDGGLSRRQAAARFGVSICECDPLDVACADHRRCRASAARWRQAFSPDRSARPGDLGSGGAEVGHHAGRAARPPRRARRVFCAVDDLEVLRAPQDHAQKKSAHAAEQDRPDVLARRQAWFEGQLDLDPEQLIFIDETGASTKMARLTWTLAYADERLRAAIPHGHWKTTTFVGALQAHRHDCADGPRRSDDRESGSSPTPQQVLRPDATALVTW